MTLNIHGIATMPKTLLWDIETGKGYAEVPFYQLKQFSKYINHKYIKRHPWIVCASFMNLYDTEEAVKTHSVLDDKERFKECFHDDYYVVSKCADIINSADILIAHNGDSFDWKFFVGRCLAHNIEPPQKPTLIDTLKIARKEFRVASNTLSYLARYLGVEDKDESPDWDKIKDGDVDEINHCISYNKVDVVVLKRVYERLRPYSTNHPNINPMLSGVHHNTCTKCGHWDLVKEGFRYTKAGKYQQYRCKKDTGGCGGWSSDKKNLKKVDLR